MAKIGDTVRYLNSVGGGVITKIDGRMAYVEENGFETPVLLGEVVVVMPAGHSPQGGNARLMFDQKAFDEGRKEPKKASDSVVEEKIEEPQLPVEETSHGEKMNIALAFEPRDLKKLSSTSFGAVLVNDSNYFLSYALLGRSAEARGWDMIAHGEIAPNELVDVLRVTHESLGKIERISFQCIAYKKDKTFTLKSPINVARRLDLTKFHKLHCFRPGIYFDNPVLEVSLVKDDVQQRPVDVDPEDMARSIGEASFKAKSTVSDAETLSKKFKVETSGRKGKDRKNPDSSNPHKLLPLVEVDLHIGELIDSTLGMEAKDMLELQLDTVRKTMKAHRQRIGQKIVFIHGKGEGVLRNEVLKLLRREYPKAELQDASFREYGFGATLVTIH